MEYRLKIEKSNVKYWTKLAILMLIFMGGGYLLNFAIDTYWTFHFGFDYAAEDMLMRNGRPVIALVYKLFALTGAQNEVFYYVSLIMAVVCFMFAIHVYAKLLRNYISDENLAIILSTICILNLYAIEFFMFIEKGPFALSVLFNVIAVYYIYKGFTADNRKLYIVAMLFILLAAMTYQGTVALFFVLALPILYKECVGLIDYIKAIIILALVYWIPMGIDVICFKIWFSDERAGYTNSMADIISRIINVIKYSYKTTFELLPRNLFLVLLILVFLVNIIAIAIKKEKLVLAMINIFVILLAVSIIPTAGALMASFLRPRMIYPMASAVGILAVNYFVNCRNDNWKYDIHLKTIVAAVCIILVVLEYFSYTKIYIDKYKMNYADYVRVQEIGAVIKEYELETGNTIKQIAFYRDYEHNDPYYKELYSNGDLVVSGFHSWDSQLNMVNYYLGTDYQRCPEDKGYEEYFSKLDWDCYSPSQIICDKDTLHYCVY